MSAIDNQLWPVARGSASEGIGYPSTGTQMSIADTVAEAGLITQNPIMNAVIDTILNNSKPKQCNAVRCELCECEMSSELVYKVHIAGAKHNKKLKAKQNAEELRTKGLFGATSQNDPNAFRCELCCVIVNSPQQLELHVGGTKHKKKLAKTTDGTLPMPTPLCNPVSGEPAAKKKKGKEDVKEYKCDLCSVIVNSELQIEQHMGSKKHLNKAKGQQNKLPFNRDGGGNKYGGKDSCQGYDQNGYGQNNFNKNTNRKRGYNVDNDNGFNNPRMPFNNQEYRQGPKFQNRPIYSGPSNWIKGGTNFGWGNPPPPPPLC